MKEINPPLSDYSVVNLTEQQLPEVLVLEHQCYAFPWTEGIFRDCFNGGYVCRGLYQDGKLCAYGIVSVAVEECHILNICVALEYQGRGIGKAFLTQLLDEARVWDAKIAFLEVRASNVAGLALYSALGFSEIGCRKGYYRNGDNREDALVLSLPLHE